MTKMKTIDVIALVLLIIGGINWGLVGLFRFDLVQWLFGSIPVLRDIIYVVVALAALYAIAYMVRDD